MTDNPAPHETSWVPNEPDRTTFAYRVRLLRTDLGLTTKEMGALVGVPHTTWTGWENGHSPRDKGDLVELIHTATGVSRNWLMWGSTSARMYAPDLVGLPSMLDNRFRSTKDSPILTIVTTDD